ncbi:DKNYY domain-containing protein [Hymenobacter ruber]
MKYDFKSLLLVTVVLSLMTSCNNGYKVEHDGVYYEHWNEGSGQNKQKIETADTRTFKELNFDCDCSFKFGKDKNHLYIDGKQIKNMDPSTFRYVGNYVFRDNKSAYFFGFYNDINDCAIKDVNPDKIELISYPWSKAGNLLIHGRDVLVLDDIDSFKPIDKDWGITKQHVIYKSRVLVGADPASFEVINSYSGKDKLHDYEFGKIKD